MDDIKTMVKKINEIYKTEYHEDLETEKMLIENSLTKYLSSQLEPLVSGKFAEENIKKRYDMICKQIELWQKRIKKEWSYEDRYKSGLTYAEKQFRNLFE